MRNICYQSHVIFALDLVSFPNVEVELFDMVKLKMKTFFFY